jgi:hypothetical protein
MKVDEGLGSHLQETLKKGAERGTKEGAFQRVMDQVISGGDQERGIPIQSPPGPVAHGVVIEEGVSGVKDAIMNAGSRRVLEGIREALDIVDFYAAKLADASQPIATMYPLIGHLREQMEGLQGLVSEPGVPERLKPLISDTVLTIGTEIAKFERGDYA